MKSLLLYLVLVCSAVSANAQKELQELLPLKIEYGIDNLQLLRRPDLKEKAELPEEIRLRLDEHLKSKLGKDIFERLMFNGLWEIDEDKLIKKNLRGLREEEKIYRYHIEYQLSLKEFNISELKAYIRLKKDLTIQRDIGLPRQDDRPILVPIEKVWPKAMSKLTERDFYDIDLAYDEGSDQLNWAIRSVTRIVNSGQGKEVIFDGKTGDFITIRDYGYDGF